MSNVKRYWCARVRLWCHMQDDGSSTMAGVALMCMAAILLSALAAGGNIVLRQSQARTAADLAALGAAQALWSDDTADPCALAAQISSDNAGTIESCTVDGDDVQVQVMVPTQVPLIDHVSEQSRAGPRACSSNQTQSTVQHAVVERSRRGCG